MNKCETCVYHNNYDAHMPDGNCEECPERIRAEEIRYEAAVKNFPVEYRLKYKKDCMYDLVSYVLTTLVKDPIEHYQFTKVLKKAYKDCTGEDYKKSEVK